MLDKILIIDFEDSFTFNIANILYSYEKSVRVLGHEFFFHTNLNDLVKSTERHAVILGPGPGHPDDYQKYFNDIKRMKDNPNCFLMGICLGHQILGRLGGHKIERSKNPMHGQAVEIGFKGQRLQVQRYNSLAVIVDGKECDILEFERGVSYQFHPESIGTYDNDIFFQDLLNFVHS